MLTPINLHYNPLITNSFKNRYTENYNEYFSKTVLHNLKSQFNNNKQTFKSITKNNNFGSFSPFTKVFIIKGIGYQAEIIENDLKTYDNDFIYKNYLLLRVGHSFNIYLPIPQDIGIKILYKERKVVIFGFDKNKISNFFKKIFKFRPPSVYTGRGIRIKKGNHKRKLGKKDIKKGKI